MVVNLYRVLCEMAGVGLESTEIVYVTGNLHGQMEMLRQKYASTVHAQWPFSSQGHT